MRDCSPDNKLPARLVVDTTGVGEGMRITHWVVGMADRARRAIGGEAETAIRPSGRLGSFKFHPDSRPRRSWSHVVSDRVGLRYVSTTTFGRSLSTLSLLSFLSTRAL